MVLRGYAENHFNLNSEMQGGVKLRDHYEQYEKSTGKTPEELEDDFLSYDLLYIWNWFLELHSTRTNNGFGASPISYLEIGSWVMLNEIFINGFEVKAIKEIDRVYLEWTAKQSKKK